MQSFGKDLGPVVGPEAKHEGSARASWIIYEIGLFFAELKVAVCDHTRERSAIAPFVRNQTFGNVT